MPFTSWIREVIRWRRGLSAQPSGADPRSEAIRRGIDASVRGGATTLGEIATVPWSNQDHRYAGMQGVSFLELLGLAPERHRELSTLAADYIVALQGQAPVVAGLSPHAPYTVGLQLVADVAALSARSRVPVAMHLAETREELELLHSGSGPFRELLDELQAWYPSVIPRGSTPLDYLKLLATADRSLVVHGNYLGADEIAFAARHNERMSVIYCPRTHAYFAHDPYPLREMLDAGVNVALGTDSRGSNPDLSMLGELRFAARQHAALAPEAILRLATINAAKALGVGITHGTLTRGKRADLLIVAITPDTYSDPFESLFASEVCVEQVLRGGQPIWVRDSQ